MNKIKQFMADKQLTETVEFALVAMTMILIGGIITVSGLGLISD